MKAISLWQPWAQAIAVGAKTVETRSWKTNYRGPIAIHAAKTQNAETHQATNAFRADPDIAPGEIPAALPFGAFVALATLYACYQTEDIDRWYYISATENRYGNYEPGRFGWVLKDIQALDDPVPYRGRQGLFEVPDEIISPHKESQR